MAFVLSRDMFVTMKIKTLVDMCGIRHLKTWKHWYKYMLI